MLKIETHFGLKVLPIAVSTTSCNECCFQDRESCEGVPCSPSNGVHETNVIYTLDYRRELTPEKTIELAKKAGFYFHTIPEHAPIRHTSLYEYSEHCFHRFVKLIEDYKEHNID
jgi:hypothetical protein